MLSRLWREEEGGEEEEDAGSWARSRAGDSGEEISLPCLKSILDEDWYASAASPAVSINAGDTSFAGINPSDASLLLPPPSIDSSSVFPLDHSVHHSFFPSKPALSSLIPSVCSNPFDAGFDFSSDNPAFFHPSSGFAGGVLGFNSAQIGGQDLFPVAANPTSFDSFEFSPFLNRGKILRPLEIFPPVGAQPNLFQKRAAAALRLNSAAMGEEKGVDLGLLGQESLEKMRRLEEELDDASIDASGLNYDSEDACDVAAETALKADDEKNEGAGNVSITGVSLSGGGGPKGRKKGLPAKNLMAERRRRKKLNDRLYMLRSVVPKISKMDRASILGDAIEYLKELLQRINDLHNELESTNSALPISNTASFRPLTPTPPALPCRIKEELCPSSLPSPNGQPARVEVRVREGRAVNIHMFCARRPGLLLSTMQALDGLGLDIQQAVISCFNGFALDIFRAEQAKDGPGVLPEEIKEVLLHSAGFQNAV